MNTHLDELINRWREGKLSEEELCCLTEALDTPEGRAALRGDWFLDAALPEALRTSPVLKLAQELDPMARAQAKRWTGWLSWRPLTAAAAGLVIGLFSASVVFAYVAPSLRKAMTLRVFEDSFEAGGDGTVPGLRSECNVWSGDTAQVVPAEQGVTPKAGGKMLRFVSATYPGAPAQLSRWCDVYRLVDLRGQSRDATALLKLSASFAAAAIADSEKFECSVEMSVLEIEMTDLPQPPTLPSVAANSMSVVTRRFPMPRNDQWQDVTAEVPLSPQARYVLLHLAVLRVEPPLSMEPVHFSAHYLDAVKLELITPPYSP